MLSKISCPACDNAQINIDCIAFMQGASFSCPNCEATVALPKNSLSKYEKAIHRVQYLKSTAETK